MSKRLGPYIFKIDGGVPFILRSSNISFHFIEYLEKEAMETLERRII